MVGHVFGVGNGAVVFVPVSVFIPPCIPDFGFSPFRMGGHQVGVYLPGGEAGLDVDGGAAGESFPGDGGVPVLYNDVFCFSVDSSEPRGLGEGRRRRELFTLESFW